MRSRALLVFLCLFLSGRELSAQTREQPLNLFGYYQNAFEYRFSDVHATSNTFLVQQLNIIAQKDISPRFRSFVNIEFLNTFDGSLGWGSASLKEAWVRYDVSPKFKLKMGLHIPIFNYLNEIKTRTPLLPYVVRPIVYEESLGEIIRIEEYIPESAFLQAYGSLPSESIGFDYAVFFGNSQNINADSNQGQTGVDTTRSVLVGGRAGLHWENLDSPLYEMKLGVSTTFDKVNIFTGVSDLLTNDPAEQSDLARSLEQIPRWRLGVDLSMYWKKFYLQSELIAVLYSENTEVLDVDRTFLYATAGFWASDKLELYGSYWRTNEVALIRDRRQNPLFRLDEEVSLDVYTLGARYNITPRLVLKAQVAKGQIASRARIMDVLGVSNANLSELPGEELTIYALALSVFF